MKRIKLTAAVAVALFSIGLLQGCDIFEEVGTCALVTIDADGNETRTDPLPYYGEDLQNKKDSSPQTVEGGITTFWECY